MPKSTKKTAAVATVAKKSAKKPARKAKAQAKAMPGPAVKRAIDKRVALLKRPNGATAYETRKVNGYKDGRQTPYSVLLRLAEREGMKLRSLKKDADGSPRYRLV